MNVAPTVFDIGARPLGYYDLMASWCRRLDGKWEPSVIITSAAVTDEGARAQVQSVTISSRAGLTALREVIDEALGVEPAAPLQAGPAPGSVIEQAIDALRLARERIMHVISPGELPTVLERAIIGLRGLAAPPTNICERWSIERDGDALLVCFNDHAKSMSRHYVRFVPEDTQASVMAPTAVARVDFNAPGKIRWLHGPQVPEGTELCVISLQRRPT